MKWVIACYVVMLRPSVASEHGRLFLSSDRNLLGTREDLTACLRKRRSTEWGLGSPASNNRVQRTALTPRLMYLGGYNPVGGTGQRYVWCLDATDGSFLYCQASTTHMIVARKTTDATPTRPQTRRTAHLDITDAY